MSEPDATGRGPRRARRRPSAEPVAERPPARSSPRAPPAASLFRAGNGAVGDALRRVDAAANASGRPLEDPVRGEMEERFGEDLGDVRLHDDAGTAHATRALNANAVTVGPHILLATSLTAIGDAAARRLLTHELAHTIQQRRHGDGVGAVAPSGPGERAATAAESGGNAAAASAPAAAPPALARQNVTPGNPKDLKDEDLQREYEIVAARLAAPSNYPGRDTDESYFRALKAEVDRRQVEASAPPLAGPPTPPIAPTEVASMSPQELFEERDKAAGALARLGSAASGREHFEGKRLMLDAEINRRRTEFENDTRAELPAMAQALDARMGVRTDRPYKPQYFVDSISMEGYGEKEFQLFAHFREQRIRAAIFATMEVSHHTVSLGVLNWVTGEAKPASYVQHRGGAESEGLGPLDYVLDIATGIGILRSIGRIALKRIAIALERRAAVALERGLGGKALTEAQGALQRRAASPGGKLPTTPPRTAPPGRAPTAGGQPPRPAKVGDPLVPEGSAVNDVTPPSSAPTRVAPREWMEVDLEGEAVNDVQAPRARAAGEFEFNAPHAAGGGGRGAGGGRTTPPLRSAAAPRSTAGPRGPSKGGGSAAAPPAVKPKARRGSEGGPGQWQSTGGAGRNMKPEDAAYETSVPPGKASAERGYFVGGREFDNWDPARRVLVDAKRFEKGGRFVGDENYRVWYKGQSLLEQAEAQVEVLKNAQKSMPSAKDVTIEWHVPSKEAKSLLDQMMKANNLPIKIVVTP